MIRWCSYCQSYMGESSPFDKYSLTHGICPVCAESSTATTPGAQERLRPVTELFRDIRQESRNGVSTSPSEWIGKGAKLGIKPADLLIGILQPALYDIGKLWSEGKVTVANEHRFSAFSGETADLVYTSYPELARHRQSRRPDILLTNSEGNYHTLGIKFLEVYLLSKGYRTFTVLPGLPVRETLELAGTLKARTIGISVSMITQMKAVREFSAELYKLPLERRPRVLVGGMPIKEGLILPPELGITSCRDIASLSL